MTTNITMHPTQSPTTGPAEGTMRARRLALAGLAALLMTGCGATGAVVADDDAGSGPSPARTSTPLTLSVEAAGPAPAAKCVEPSVDLLRSYPVAFEGTVTSRGAEGIDFRIDHWFRGGDAATARLTSDQYAQSPDALTFDIGESYLVTAANGVVPICGGSSLATQETRQLFDQAFPA